MMLNWFLHLKHKAECSIESMKLSPMLRTVFIIDTKDVVVAHISIIELIIKTPYTCCGQSSMKREIPIKDGKERNPSHFPLLERCCPVRDGGTDLKTFSCSRSLGYLEQPHYYPSISLSALLL